MKKKKITFNGRPVSVSKESYQNNGTLAVILTYEDDEDTEVITVNLNDPLQSDSMAYLDINHYPQIEKWVQKYNLGLPMGVMQRSGFCQYPLYTLFI